MVSERRDRISRGGGGLRVALRRLGFVLQAVLCVILLLWTLREEQYQFAAIAALLAVAAATLFVRDLHRGG